MEIFSRFIKLNCCLISVIIGYANCGNQAIASDDQALYDDITRETKSTDEVFFRSEKIDFIQIPSSLNPDIRFAIVVHKPETPSPLLLTTHGWHMSVERVHPGSKNPYPGYLAVQVDMRGRAFSTGKQDANGFELYDVYDALQFVEKEYVELISDPEQVYFVGGSGGGGNALGLAGKFPDLFVSITASCGISDYAKWYATDDLGEFQDELEPWIGCKPSENPEAYASRSGITTVDNVLSPVYLAHGETDQQVPSYQSRDYYHKAKSLGKPVHYLELKNAGGRRHWDNITEEQMESLRAFHKVALSNHTQPPELPESGDLVVAGYLVTKKFAVFLESVDQVGHIHYDLKKKEVTFLERSGTVRWQN